MARAMIPLRQCFALPPPHLHFVKMERDFQDTLTFRASVFTLSPSAIRTVIVAWPVLESFQSSTVPDLPLWVPAITSQ